VVLGGKHHHVACQVGALCRAPTRGARSAPRSKCALGGASRRGRLVLCRAAQSSASCAAKGGRQHWTAAQASTLRGT
jgi:hypothetical protein